MKTVEMDLKIKHQRSGINMSYNFIGSYVGYDMRRLQQARNETIPQVTLDAYIKVFTLHELGHAMDQSALMASLPRTIEIYKAKRSYSQFEQFADINRLRLIIEEHEMNIVFEKTAWLNAEKLNRFYKIVDWETFARLKKHSLSTYTNSYKKDLAIYRNLLAEQKQQVAS